VTASNDRNRRLGTAYRKRETYVPPVERYHDETVTIAPGDVRYTIDLDDDEVEKLASGHTPRRVMDRAYAMLAWKREAAQDWASYEPTSVSRVRRRPAERQHTSPCSGKRAGHEDRDRDGK
jgi:hypothetical protein